MSPFALPSRPEFLNPRLMSNEMRIMEEHGGRTGHTYLRILLFSEFRSRLNATDESRSVAIKGTNVNRNGFELANFLEPRFTFKWHEANSILSNLTKLT